MTYFGKFVTLDPILNANGEWEYYKRCEDCGLVVPCSRDQWRRLLNEQLGD